MPALTLMKVAEEKVWLRKGKTEPSSDEQGIEEVLVKKAYLRPRLGFDILPGETWLDLGANIGAFAVLCRSKDATAVCFEPEPSNFRILEKNAKGFRCYQLAVTALRDKQLTFRKSKNPENNYRGTILPVESYVEIEPVNNLYAGELTDYLGKQFSTRFDGIKCDIEGSEFGLIDEWLFPRATKLVMEYHYSRDKSIENFHKRMTILRKHYKNVKYPSVFDAVLRDPIKFALPRYDQLVFCWGLI